MPAFDFPLEKLRTYQGINPRPGDFDAYWDRALKELDAIDPDIELAPYTGLRTESAECFDLYFTGVRGARIHSLYLRPKNLKGPAPTVLLFHGYSGSGGGWFDKLAWVAEGFCVAALDCRGQGGRSEDTGGVIGNTLRGHIIRGLSDDPDNLLFRQIFLDTAELARVVLGFDEVDGSRLYAHGGSQGGGLTLACAALEPRVSKAAPVFPFLTDYQRVWNMDLAVAAYEELTTYFRNFDPLHQREHEIWEKLGYIDVQHLAPKIKAEILMFTGLMDQVCPPSSQFAAYNKITSKKDVIIYPDFKHEGLPEQADRVLNFFKA